MLDQVYRVLPVAGQNLACSLIGLREKRIRMGKGFWDYYRSLQESETATRQRIDAYQSQKVRELLDHAYGTVPFYRRIMDERGLSPADVRSRDDLKKLPVLTKENVREHARELFSKGFRGRVLKKKTSGTTGKALTFFTTPDAVSFQWAVWWRQRSRFNIYPLERHLNFTGKLVVPIAQSTPPFWRWNWPFRQALVNMQSIVPEKIEAIASFAGERSFSFFAGYPSIISSFCDMMLEQGLELSTKPRMVFLGAEPVQELQLRSIRNVTKAGVTDQYGFSEGCGNASRCEYGRYHEDWEFGVLECVDPEPVSDDGVRGRIVATGFANMAFPLVRYDTGDRAIWEKDSFHCECGRESRVIREIQGRSEDFVITPEGSRIMRFDYLFKDTDQIKEAQIIQEKKGEIIIRFVPRPDFRPAIEEQLRRSVREWVSPNLTVHFESVRTLTKGENGKFRPVISNLTKGQTGDRS